MKKENIIRWTAAVALAGASVFGYARSVQAQSLLVVELGISGGSSCNSTPAGNYVMAQGWGIGSQGQWDCNINVDGEYEPYGTATSYCLGTVSHLDAAIYGETTGYSAQETICSVWNIAPNTTASCSSNTYRSGCTASTDVWLQ